ncbi:MAG TPA: phycobilisome rod-core linker polypeptide, partial [Rudaea sp.]
MPSKWLRHLFFIGFAGLAAPALLAADCQRLLMPDLSFAHVEPVFDLSYLATIDAANFGAHRANAQVERGPAEHPESFRADEPVGLGLPISKEILRSSPTFEEFAAQRAAKYKELHFNYPLPDLATFFERSLPAGTLERYETCTHASGAIVRIQRADEDFVQVMLGWKGDAADAIAITKPAVTGATLRGSVVPSIKGKQATKLVFVRDLDKDFRLTTTVGGKPVSIFVPRAIGAKAAEPELKKPCASAANVVKAAYRRVLGRDASPAEAAAQAAALTNGTRNVRQLVALLTTSDEYEKKFVAGKTKEDLLGEMYRRLLGREADTPGLNYNLRLVQSGYQNVA